MTIVSTGYTGAIAPNVTWANMQKALACQYMVDKPADAVVSGVSGGTRQVQVATGFIGGWGILDQITVAETVQLDTVASGIHYWLIVAHRDWTTTNPSTGKPGITTIAAVDAGTALPSTLPARTTGPGVVDEQPLALVSIAASDTLPQVVFDLRCIGGPDSYTMSADLAGKPNWVGYMARQGVQIRCGNTTYTRIMDPQTLNGMWDVDPTIVRSGPDLSNGLSMVAGTGWVGAVEFDCHGTRSGNNIALRLQARRSGSDISISGTGGISGGDTTIATVNNSDFHPPYDINNVDIWYHDTDLGTFHGGGTYKANGDLILESGCPNTTISKQPSGTLSVAAVISWIREG